MAGPPCRRQPQPRSVRRRSRGRRAFRLGDWKVAELYVERRGQRSIVGNIYKGVVDNVLPGMEAAFVDIGLDRNGFLHVDEIVLPGGEAGARAAAAARGGGSTSCSSRARRSSSRSSRTR